jgi:hypothetical protein
MSVLQPAVGPCLSHHRALSSTDKMLASSRTGAFLPSLLIHELIETPGHVARMGHRIIPRNGLLAELAPFVQAVRERTGDQSSFVVFISGHECFTLAPASVGNEHTLGYVIRRRVAYKRQ